jgi:hypothetical protein
MIAQYDNKLLSSFLLLVDHQIQSKGQAFTNFSSQFFPVFSNIQGQYAYASPFKSLCNDTSISGANILSGVYLNGNYINIGQSGLSAINHYQGAVYFTNPLPAQSIVSGNYAIKDFSVELTDQPEYKLLFQTKYITSTKFNQVLSGLALDEKTSPIVFLRTKTDDDAPFALGGLENKKKIIRAIIIADNEYQKIAVCSILKSMMYSPFYLTTKLPFDAAGNMTGLNYNYDNLIKETAFFPWIMKTKVIDVLRAGDFESINKNVSMIDFEVQTIAQHSY